MQFPVEQILSGASAGAPAEAKSMHKSRGLNDLAKLSRRTRRFVELAGTACTRRDKTQLFSWRAAIVAIAALYSAVPCVAADAMAGMQMDGEHAGSSPRDGSGTAWQADSAPMFMKSLPSVAGFDWSAMGTLQAGYVDAGGKRGDRDPFAGSMIMLMGQREVGGGTLGVHLMTSLDPFIDGRKGVPNLFKNGFSYQGADIGDRKDPHNVFAEVAASYSHKLADDWSAFIYGGPVGDPALGNTMFLHRACYSACNSDPLTRWIGVQN